jgi:PAS domain S-box-containing protein
LVLFERRESRSFSCGQSVTQERGDPEAAERLQLALDAGAIVGTWVWEVPTNRFTADERFARSFGLSADLCRSGLPLDQVTASIHPADQERVNQAIGSALDRGGPYRCEYRARHQDGSYRWIEANGRVELAPDGSAQRFPGVLLDIEARRTAESERDRMSELLRTFTAAVPGVVYAKDREGRMLVANEGTTALIGKPPEFYLGRTDLEFLDDKAQAAIVMATDRRIMDSGVAEQIEEDVSLADGTAATWLSTKTPLRNDKGAVIGLIGSSIDVTARKRAEAALQELNATLEQKVQLAIEEREAAQAALRQSQKMEAVGQLTGGIAHDFNNLLMGISGSLEILQTRIAQGKVGEIERYVSAAQGAAKRAAALTHRLLAFSRRQTLDPRSIDINRLVLDMEVLVRRTVGPHIHIEIVGAGGLWPTLIDQNQLENALLNLCINARDAMPDGGRMTIETANKWLDERAAQERDLPPGQYVSLCVTDTGTGMTPEVMQRACDPFFTTKPLGEGTGLGLSMIYGFVRQSGGQVRIYSELGQGTTVCLYMPRDHTARGQEQHQEPTRAEFSGAGEVVLIVDDEPTIRMLVGEVLDECGYAGLEADNGPAGLKLLQSGARIDLLITDVGLPGGINGRQLADAGRALRPGLKVLFITGYAENAVVSNGHLESGMQILTKPFSMEILAQRIRAMVEP